MEITITQNQEVWLEARKSRFTASEIHKLMGKGNPLTKTAETFVYEKASEILTGIKKPIYGDALTWGIEHEAEAFEYFSKITFEPFTYYGGQSYVFIPYGDHSGYSPDGLGENAILEIKCPYNSANHLKNFTIYDADSLKSLHPEYYWQVQLGMIATNLDKAYFVSYDPRMPQGKRIHVAEIERHLVQDEIDEKLEHAVELLNSVIAL
jgi:putative phage-type endonuclease